MEYKIKILNTHILDQKDGLENVILMCSLIILFLDSDSGDILLKVRRSIQLPPPDTNKFLPLENIDIGLLEEWCLKSETIQKTIEMNMRYAENKIKSSKITKVSSDFFKKNS